MSERGDIVLGWLLKLVISLAIFGVVAFEAGAVIVAHVTADGTANDVVNEAAFVYARGSDAEAAEKAAAEEATRAGARLIAFEVASDGGTVSVTVLKEAKTIFLHRISATKSWTEARSTRRRGVITN
jgi:hypothetical protein